MLETFLFIYLPITAIVGVFSFMEYCWGYKSYEEALSLTLFWYLYFLKSVYKSFLLLFK